MRLGSEGVGALSAEVRAVWQRGRAQPGMVHRVVNEASVVVSLPFRSHDCAHRLPYGDNGTTACTRKKRLVTALSVKPRVVVEPGSGETAPSVRFVTQAPVVRLVRSSM